MSRAPAISCEWALATDDAQGCSLRAPRPPAVRSAFSLVSSVASRTPTDGDGRGTGALRERVIPGSETVMPGSGRGTGVSAEAGTAAPPRTTARATAGAGQILRNAANPTPDLTASLMPTGPSGGRYLPLSGGIGKRTAQCSAHAGAGSLPRQRLASTGREALAPVTPERLAQPHGG